MLKTTCSLPGCEKNIPSHRTHPNLCPMHYSRDQRNGSPHIISIGRIYERFCIISGCKNPTKSCSLCSMHLRRFYRKGDPYQSSKVFWTAKEDQHLIDLLYGDPWSRTRPGELRALAIHLERTAGAATTRLCGLRKKEKARLREAVKTLE